MHSRELTVVTLNIAGAMRLGNYSQNNIGSLARKISGYNPDVVGLQ